MGLEVEGKVSLDNGEWWKIKIPPERARFPVEAFGTGLLPLPQALQKQQKEYNQNKESTIPFLNKLNKPLFINK